jgi:16S rRNA (adenine1518-N6/adenine1519-N6)-dimethyltransferase
MDYCRGVDMPKPIEYSKLKKLFNMLEKMDSENKLIEKKNGDLKKEIIGKLEGINFNTDNLDQHFLVSSEAINRLIDSADLNKEDVVIEIGPGPGQITEKISERAGAVHGIELDQRFQPLLEDIAKRHPNAYFIFGSALDTEWPSANKMIMNPPFSIIEPLMEKIILETEIERVSMMIGERFCDRCFSPDLASRTAFLTNAYFKCARVARLDKDVFFPRSRDRAVIMSLERLDKKNINSDLRFVANLILKVSNSSIKFIFQNLFSKRFKNVNKRNLLSYPSISSLGIPEQVMRKRVHDLTNQDYSQIFRGVSKLRKIRLR